MMKIIRDTECSGIFMIPLFIDWKLKRCNQARCRNRPTTIIAGMGDGIPVFALCEYHFQLGNKDDGGVNLVLEFDDFDAFDIGEIVPATLEEVAQIEIDYQEDQE